MKTSLKIALVSAINATLPTSFHSIYIVANVEEDLDMIVVTWPWNEGFGLRFMRLKSDVYVPLCRLGPTRIDLYFTMFGLILHFAYAPQVLDCHVLITKYWFGSKCSFYSLASWASICTHVTLHVLPSTYIPWYQTCSKSDIGAIVTDSCHVIVYL